jgi:pyruvate/2-oxoglutarate dehydrogenase complex dihydrolipoamide dehydrogenase (E3) component
VASRSDVSNRHDVVVIGAGPAGEAAAELGGSLGYKVALVERDVVGGTVVTSGGAPTKTFREAAGTGQAMIHNEATIEDVIRMAYNTPTYTYGYKLAASDALARLHPDVLRAMRLPSRAHRI